jgi:two-component system sensor histidine kinase HydH
VVAYRQQSNSYQNLAEQLTETNQALERAHAETRRSERLAALGQLTAGLAHEIRNPLGIIKGSAEILKQKLEGSNALAVELSGYIFSEVNRLSALVSRFLDFARPLQADRQPSDVTEVLEKALRPIREQWKGGAVVVERAYQPNLPAVPLDPTLCEQVFVNLIQNAFEAMGDKGGTLRMGTAAINDFARSGIEVTIQDTGPGISAELREQIFNPFVTTKSTGVGLGLSIVSQIMDEHKGSIRRTRSRSRLRFVFSCECRSI